MMKVIPAWLIITVSLGLLAFAAAFLWSYQRSASDSQPAESTPTPGTEQNVVENELQSILPTPVPDGITDQGCSTENTYDTLEEAVRSTNTACQLSLYGVATVDSSIGALSRLQTLVITNGSMQTLPDAIGNLSSLTFLHLANNANLQELPVTIRRLNRLEFLNISNTAIQSIPPGFTQMASLATLIISQDQLSDEQKALLTEQMPQLSIIETDIAPPPSR